jgi:hypothetical protein
MYHAIVLRRVVGLFAAVSNGNARPVLEGLAPRFEHAHPTRVGTDRAASGLLVITILHFP